MQKKKEKLLNKFPLYPTAHHSPQIQQFHIELPPSYRNPELTRMPINSTDSIKMAVYRFKKTFRLLQQPVARQLYFPVESNLAKRHMEQRNTTHRSSRVTAFLAYLVGLHPLFHYHAHHCLPYLPKHPQPHPSKTNCN